MYTRNFYNGFTLAEVLITIGIVGIVASMTIPVLINSYKEKVLVTQAKKSYSNISNAINRWNADNGSVGDYEAFWTSGTSNEIMISLAKYMNTANICTSNANMDKCGGIYEAKAYKKLNDGNGNTVGWKYATMNERRIVLIDGSFINLFTEVQNGSCCHTYFNREIDENGNYIPDPTSPTGYKGEYATSCNCGFLTFDTNGLKGPNTYGKDIFCIRFSANKMRISEDLFGNLEHVLRTDKLIKTENYTPGKF